MKVKYTYLIMFEPFQASPFMSKDLSSLSMPFIYIFRLFFLVTFISSFVPTGLFLITYWRLVFSCSGPTWRWGDVHCLSTTRGRHAMCSPDNLLPVSRFINNPQSQRAGKCIRHFQPRGSVFVRMPYESHDNSLQSNLSQHNRTSVVLFWACMGKCTGSSENTKPCQKSHGSLFLDFTPFLLGPSQQGGNGHMWKGRSSSSIQIVYCYTDHRRNNC